MKKIVLQGAIALLLVLVVGWLALNFVRASAELEKRVAANNVVAETASARLERLEETGQLVGALQAHLATNHARAVELWGDSIAQDRENARLRRQLSTAQTATARLEVELRNRPIDPPAVNDGILRASFAGASLSNGDTIAHESDLTLPLADPDGAELVTRLTASLTIDTRFLWGEDGTPLCQISVRHEDVEAVPGRCLEVLGTRPIEEWRLDLPLLPELSPEATVAVVGTLAYILGRLLP